MEVVHQEPKGKVFRLYKQLLICEGKKVIIKRRTKTGARLDFLKRRMNKSREITIDTTQELVKPN